MRECACGSKVEAGVCPHCDRWNDGVVLAPSFELDLEAAQAALRIPLIKS